MNKRILVAMSGGVDSSVTALLLRKKGYECVGMTMDLFCGSSLFPENESALKDAENICIKMGIDHKVLRLGEEFKQHVINNFASSYERGETPNPCIVCNKYMKFGALLKAALDLGCEGIATGHYARVEYNNDSGRYLLKKARDSKKDQSYVLYSLTQEILARTIFPLGDLSKTEVREIAKENGFLNADKPESQDICFVKDKDYSDFIEEFTGKEYPPGDFLDMQGNVIGRHRGIIRYTIGQRKGLGVSLGQPAFVYNKDPVNNTVTLACDSELYSDRVTVKDINLIMTDKIKEGLRLSAKTRYNQKEQPARVLQTGVDTLEIIFDEPQRAIAKGQAAVLYDGDYVFGGGTIV